MSTCQLFHKAALQILKTPKVLVSRMLVAPAPAPLEQFESIQAETSAKPSPYPSETQLQPVENSVSKDQLDIVETPSDTGLQELVTVEKLYITKKVAVKQVLSLRNQRNRYQIRAANKKLVYSVVEENSWWMGFLCYGLRPCQLKIMNEAGEEIIRINRPFAFTTRVTPCQLQRMEVFAPPDTLIGTIEQQWSPLKPLYTIKGQEGEELFSLRGKKSKEGPANTLGIYKDLQFDISRPDGAHVGSTSKRWRGIVHALFRSPILDKFGVAFERDLAVEEKVLLLASTLLVDYMYYDT